MAAIPRVEGRDDLNVDGNPAFVACVAQFRADPKNKDAFCGVDPGALEEKVMSSKRVVKINRKARRQTREVVITNLAVYNFKCGKYRLFQRRIALQDLDKIFLVTGTTQFVLHMSEYSAEYDYRFDAGSAECLAELTGILKQAYLKITGNQLSQLTVEERLLDSLLITKQKIKDRPKDSSAVSKNIQKTRRASVQANLLAISSTPAASASRTAMAGLGELGEGDDDEAEE